MHLKREKERMRELTDRFYANEMQSHKLNDVGTRIASSANEKLLIEMTTQLKLAKKKEEIYSIQQATVTRLLLALRHIWRWQKRKLRCLRFQHFSFVWKFSFTLSHSNLLYSSSLQLTLSKKQEGEKISFCTLMDGVEEK